MQRLPVILAASLLAASAMAQTSSKPLNLKLPPNSLPAASSTVAPPASSSTTAKPSSPSVANASSRAPGVYYGDTSGRMGNTEETARTQPACDDSTYNQPQVHGSVGMGVVGGSHMSGSYQTGTVSLSQAFGSCDDPHGGVSISIGGGTGHFHGR